MCSDYIDPTVIYWVCEECGQICFSQIWIFTLEVILELNINFAVNRRTCGISNARMILVLPGIGIISIMKIWDKQISKINLLVNSLIELLEVFLILSIIAEPMSGQ